MSTKQPSDDPDVDVNALHREVGSNSVAGTPTRRIQTRQRRKEAESAALHGPNTQSGTARVQNLHFEPLVSGRLFDDEYDDYEYAFGLAIVWQPTAAHHVNAQQASTVAIQDLASALIHSREGRTVHGHIRVGVTSRIQPELRALIGHPW